MKCECGKELIWNVDYDFESLGMEGDGIVTIYCCTNEDCEVDNVEVYKKFTNKIGNHDEL